MGQTAEPTMTDQLSVAAARLIRDAIDGPNPETFLAGAEEAAFAIGRVCMEVGPVFFRGADRAGILAAIRGTFPAAVRDLATLAALDPGEEAALLGRVEAGLGRCEDGPTQRWEGDHSSLLLKTILELRSRGHDDDLIRESLAPTISNSARLQADPDLSEAERQTIVGAALAHFNALLAHPAGAGAGDATAAGA